MTTIERTNNEKVQLQGIGWCKGKRAKDIKKGDIIKWNFGYTSEVIDVTFSASGKTLTLHTKDTATGKEYTRKTTPDRLFAIA